MYNVQTNVSHSNLSDSILGKLSTALTERYASADGTPSRHIPDTVPCRTAKSPTTLASLSHSLPTWCMRVGPELSAHFKRHSAVVSSDTTHNLSEHI